jgi:hypothetical protein
MVATTTRMRCKSTFCEQTQSFFILQLETFKKGVAREREIVDNHKISKRNEAKFMQSVLSSNPARLQLSSSSPRRSSDEVS